jgi:TolB-like protein
MNVSPSGNLFTELKRRKVFKVAVAYGVVAWLVIQVASTIAPQLNLPEWAPRFITLVVLLGFPIALVLAWMLDKTPEGLKFEPATVGNKRMFTIAAVLAALALGWYWQSHFSHTVDETPTSETPSVAVLPFANLSSDLEQEYFSDGMTEELLNVLAGNTALKVAARTSVFEFKGKGGDVREIGAKLGVTHIVEGSVRREGDHVRVTAQLIRVADGFHAWTETYDRQLTGVFALQDEIAQAIGTKLQSSLGVAVAPKVRAEIPPAAYDAYLKGRAFYRARKNLAQAIVHLESAVALAPEFAAGWASLALTYEVAGQYVRSEELAVLGDNLAKSRDAAQRAAAIDPEAAMTLHALADVARAEFRYANAERLYLKAMQADPTYPDVREDYSELLNQVGRDTEALAAARQLVTLEPFVRVFWSRLRQAATVLDLHEVVEEAAARIGEIDPMHYDAAMAEYVLHLAWGRIEAARAALAVAMRRAPDVAAEAALLFRWATGEPGEGEAPTRRFASPGVGISGAAYAALRGDTDLAFSIYEEVPEPPMSRMYFYTDFTAVPLQPLLADPRAKRLLREYGFEAYWREMGWPALCHPKGETDFECGPAETDGT